jgi:hypothetical protein
LVTTEYQAHLLRANAFFVLDLLLEGLDVVGSVVLQGDDDEISGA